MFVPSRAPQKIDDGLVVVNEYRASVGLALLERDQI